MNELALLVAATLSAGTPLAIAGLGLLGTGGASKKSLAERLPIARPPGLSLLVGDKPLTHCAASGAGGASPCVVGAAVGVSALRVRMNCASISIQSFCHFPSTM